MPPGCHGVVTPVPGNVWVLVEPGATVAAIGSMRMEMAISAPTAARVRERRTPRARTSRDGDLVAVLEDGG